MAVGGGVELDGLGWVVGNGGGRRLSESWVAAAGGGVEVVRDRVTSAEAVGAVDGGGRRGC